MRKNTGIIVVSCLVIVAGIVAIVFSVINPSSLTPAPVQTSPTVTSTTWSPTPSTENVPSNQDLSGEWFVQGKNGGIMSATITDGQIRMTLNNEGAKVLYWVGTFDVGATMGNKITSTKIDINKVVLSRATSKEFVIRDSTIAFEYSAGGKTTTLELRRA